MSTDVHSGPADDAEQDAGGKPHQRGGSQRAHYVIEQAANFTGKNPFFALFGVIALDHANAAEGFGEAACDFGVDLATFPENWTDGREGPVQCECETTEG